MANETTKVRTAVVGLGWPGIQHLKGYVADPRSEVIAVCDLDKKHARGVAKEYKISRVYTDHLKMLDKPLDAPSINSFDEEVKHFVGCIVDGKEPISSAEQGIMLMQMLDGIYESAQKGRSVPIADLSVATR